MRYVVKFFRTFSVNAISQNEAIGIARLKLEDEKVLNEDCLYIQCKKVVE